MHTGGPVCGSQSPVLSLLLTVSRRPPPGPATQSRKRPGGIGGAAHEWLVVPTGGRQDTTPAAARAESSSTRSRSVTVRNASISRGPLRPRRLRDLVASRRSELVAGRHRGGRRRLVDGQRWRIHGAEPCAPVCGQDAIPRSQRSEIGADTVDNSAAVPRTTPFRAMRERQHARHDVSAA